MIRSPRNQAILEGIAKANKLHREFGIRESIEENSSQVDVFQVITDLNIPLIFRPLEGLLGAFLPNPAGIIVTTERTQSIQRYTAAHELGHALLGHRVSLDQEGVLGRGPVGIPFDYDAQEAAAESFAAEFLLPKWLYIHHAAKHKWSRSELRNPEVVYQLSLRVGASYSATCWGLLNHRILRRNEVRRLLDTKVKSIKEASGARDFLENSWGNIWQLSLDDIGGVIDGGGDDVFLIALEENSQGGYLWDTKAIQENSFLLLSDQNRYSNEPVVGGKAYRHIVVKSDTPMSTTMLNLCERRPWEKGGNNSCFSVSFNLEDKEQGMSHCLRRKLGLLKAA